MGNRLTLTPELQGRIAQLVQAGSSIPHACTAAGASWNTVKVWMDQDHRDVEPYATFCRAVWEARAKWAAGAAISITAAGKKDWRALAWSLEKQCPDEYGDQAKRIELSGPNKGPIRSVSAGEAEEAVEEYMLANGWRKPDEGK